MTEYLLESKYKENFRLFLSTYTVWSKRMKQGWITFVFRDPQFYDHDHDQDDLHHYDEPTNTQAQKAINPCHPSYHRLINNQPQRSYNYRLGSSSHREHVLCDRDLTPGWYRFHSLAGDTIPTSCPGVNYCGTRAPVWMKGSVH